MGRGLQSILSALGVALLAIAMGAFLFPPTFASDPWPLGNYLASLQPGLFLAGGLCVMAALVLSSFGNPRTRQLKVGLAVAVACAGAIPTARLLLAAERGWNRERKHRLEIARAEEAMRVVPTPSPPTYQPIPKRSWVQPCGDPSPACPAGEVCFLSQGGKLTLLGATASIAGDSLCHKGYPCSAGEACYSIVEYEPNTPARVVTLCCAGEPKPRGVQPR